MLQNIINRFKLNKKGNLPITSTLLIILPFFIIIGILNYTVNYISTISNNGFTDAIQTIFSFINDLIFTFIALPMVAFAFAAFIGNFIKYTVTKHIVILGVFLIAMYPIFTFDVFDLFVTITFCVPAVLGLIASAFIEIQLKKQLQTEHYTESPSKPISETVAENVAATNIIEKIINRFTLNKANKLSALSVSIITLPFVALGLLMLNTPVLFLHNNLYNLLIGSLMMLIMTTVFCIGWVIISFLTASVIRFTSNTVANYTLLGASWLFLFALQQEFNLEYILLYKSLLICVGIPIIIGLIATSYIELKLKNKLKSS